MLGEKSIEIQANMVRTLIYWRLYNKKPVMDMLGNIEWVPIGERYAR